MGLACTIWSMLVHSLLPTAAAVTAVPRVYMNSRVCVIGDDRYRVYLGFGAVRASWKKMLYDVHGPGKIVFFGGCYCASCCRTQGIRRLKGFQLLNRWR